MYCTIIEWGTPEYEETVALRDEVLRKPLNLKFNSKDLAKEYLDFHFVCYDDCDRLLGCMVLVDLGNKQLKMRQVAVNPKVQNKGIGSYMVEASERFARDNDFTDIVLNARDVAVPFYNKLEYKKTGKPFIEVSIKHYKMTKKL